MNTCGDCGVKEGEFHLVGCDMERCFKCKGQKICCDCGYDIEREPFFKYNFPCRRCGKFSDGKMVSDKEWNFICGGTYNKKDVLCNSCMEFIKKKRG